MKNKLILINGPAGVGKSTLAKIIHENIPFSLRIDIDKIKFSISNFREDNAKSVKLSIETGFEMAKYYLCEGGSVIYDRMIWGGYNTIEKMKKFCDENDITFVHIVLNSSEDVIEKRAQERGFKYESEGGLNPEKLKKFFKEFNEHLPENISLNIDTTNLSPNEIWEKIKSELVD